MSARSDTRRRTRFALVVIILATLPCYCVGWLLVNLVESQGINTREATSTPTAVQVLVTLPASASPTLLPTFTYVVSVTPSPTLTPTATETVKPTPFIPSATPTASETPTVPPPPPTPSDTPTLEPPTPTP